MNTRIGRVWVVSSDDLVQVWVYRKEIDTSLPAGVSSHFSDRCTAVYSNEQVSSVDISLPPSETLLSLLRHFHTHRAVAPLLDRLIEEYPQLEEWVNPAEIVAAVTEGVVS